MGGAGGKGDHRLPGDAGAGGQVPPEWHRYRKPQVARRGGAAVSFEQQRALPLRTRSGLLTILRSRAARNPRVQPCADLGTRDPCTIIYDAGWDDDKTGPTYDNINRRMYCVPCEVVIFLLSLSSWRFK